MVSKLGKLTKKYHIVKIMYVISQDRISSYYSNYLEMHVKLKDIKSQMGFNN